LNSTAPFDLSGQVYDLLYRDRPADVEARYVASLLERFGGSIRGLLDLGCGTGRHARHLLELGFDVVGVERSEQMASRARLIEHLSVSTGDVRHVRLGRRFDAVLALFHVVSYQRTVQDLLDMFVTAADHLEPGGLFVFDTWSTPAVLSQRPEVRVREVSDGAIEVRRTARPVEDVRASRVDVHYEVEVTDRSKGTVESFTELHSMRHLTEAEVELLARASGFEVLHAEEFLTGAEPSAETWGVCFVLRKPHA
jgi:SAM-dependent methyltransferase